MLSPLIVALDFDEQKEALTLVDALNPSQCALKVGSEMFTHFGSGFVKALVDRQFKVFLDLKFHDIPHTVARACKAAADMGVWMTNVHASGGQEMMRAALNALEPYKADRPLLIAVTVLTSMSNEQLPSIGVDASLNQHVERLAGLAADSGLDGVVCSAHEASSIKKIRSPSFLAVTPGIRMPGNSVDDQSRIMTPEAAITAGSDYLVIGRPITKAAKPQDVVQSILQSIAS